MTMIIVGVFKQITGLSPNQYFIEMKMEKSKLMLLGEDMSCKEIAFQLGFDSPPYDTYGRLPVKSRDT